MKNPDQLNFSCGMTPRVLSAFQCGLWFAPLLRVSGFYSSLRSISMSEAVKLQDEEDDSKLMTLRNFFPRPPSNQIDDDGVAHIWINEMLVNGWPPIYEKLGLATDYRTVHASLDRMEAAKAKALLMHVDSPGGVVSGNHELATRIASLRIPTATVAEGTCCSAAYKLAAGTDRIVASQSSDVGNIGTVLSYADDARFWDEMGIEWKAITNEGADLKGTFYEQRLSESQLQFLQESINQNGREFQRHVSNSRSVDPEVFRAGWYSGKQAIQLGLIDQVGGASAALAYLHAEMKNA